MGYIQDMQECRRYIDENIGRELTPMELAKRYSYSYYHFCRIFRISNGASVAAYIRKRKLLLAVEKIERGAGIFEAALDVGFDTPSGFSKAFKKMFGCTPTQYHRNQIASSEKKGEIDVIIPNIVEKGALKAAGHKCEVEKKEMDPLTDGAYWLKAHFSEPGGGHHHHGRMGKDTVKIGMWLKEADAQGNLSYFFGTLVDSFQDADPSIIQVEIPAATYAVFTTDPLDIAKEKDHNAFANRIKETWRYIFEKWFEGSDWEIDSQGCDFEYYDWRCADHSASSMDIYVPVKKK